MSADLDQPLGRKGEGYGRDLEARMIEISEGTWQGSWTRFKTLVFLRCPRCGNGAALDHEIADDGTVFPSVECPKGCGFHDHVKLTGWIPPSENH